MAHFTAKGKRYELATVDSLSFDEAREVKRISGMAIGSLVEALGDTDPDAWLGLFVVSMQRTDDVTERDLAGENLVQMVNAVLLGDDRRPPAEGAKAPDPEESATPAESPSPNDGNGATSSSAPSAEPVEVGGLS